ncbi:hypothetical protein PR048_019093 [Dryococelus australis]|uniref:Uncharacterized protein n=1 Tax=Dryococelus australis TaxID=614101 RepID=A0ABQ9H2L8_9NEOP|nr:hypothetical protein PR048_019093 [Dryococelus australis]
MEFTENFWHFANPDVRLEFAMGGDIDEALRRRMLSDIGSTCKIVKLARGVAIVTLQLRDFKRRPYHVTECDSVATSHSLLYHNHFGLTFRDFFNKPGCQTHSSTVEALGTVTNATTAGCQFKEEGVAAGVAGEFLTPLMPKWRHVSKQLGGPLTTATTVVTASAKPGVSPEIIFKCSNFVFRVIKSGIMPLSEKKIYFSEKPLPEDLPLSFCTTLHCADSHQWYNDALSTPFYCLKRDGVGPFLPGEAGNKRKLVKLRSWHANICHTVVNVARERCAWHTAQGSYNTRTNLDQTILRFRAQNESFNEELFEEKRDGEKGCANRQKPSDLPLQQGQHSGRGNPNNRLYNCPLLILTIPPPTRGHEMCNKLAQRKLKGGRRHEDPQTQTKYTPKRVSSDLTVIITSVCNILHPRPGHYRIFASGNRTGRCHWSVGFLGDLLFLPPLHYGAAPFSPHSILIGSQDLVQEKKSEVLTKSVNCKLETKQAIRTSLTCAIACVLKPLRTRYDSGKACAITMHYQVVYMFLLQNLYSRHVITDNQSYRLFTVKKLASRTYEQSAENLVCSGCSVEGETEKSAHPRSMLGTCAEYNNLSTSLVDGLPHTPLPATYPAVTPPNANMGGLVSHVCRLPNTAVPPPPPLKNVVVARLELHTSELSDVMFQSMATEVSDLYKLEYGFAYFFKIPRRHLTGAWTKASNQKHVIKWFKCNGAHMFQMIRQHGEHDRNTARLALRSDEALCVLVSPVSLPRFLTVDT